MELICAAFSTGPSLPRTRAALTPIYRLQFGRTETRGCRARHEGKMCHLSPSECRMGYHGFMTPQPPLVLSPTLGHLS